MTDNIISSLEIMAKLFFLHQEKWIFNYKTGISYIFSSII